MSTPAALAIVGPTASGKTALSIAVARGLGGEIISMDSRQVYRFMDVGTAKATPEQRAAVAHHGIDLVDPGTRFGAGQFGRLARGWIAEIAARGHLPILVGGTGFFLRSLTHPIFREPELDPVRRARLAAFLETLPDAELHAWLAALDAPSAERLRTWGGRQRLLRALEIPLLTGRSLSWWHRTALPEAPAIAPLVFVLDPPRDRLFAAIDARAGEMARAGLADEVERLLARGYDERDPGMSATGYVELIPAVRGEISLDEALERVRANTRAYARRQLTWFRHKLPPGAIWLDASRPVDDLAREIAARWRAARSGEAPSDTQRPTAEGER